MDKPEINVLIIEDNENFARLVQIYLRRYHDVKFNIIWKENGEYGIKELKENGDIDIILMDYFLPGQNGLDTTLQLRELGITTPVVFLTVNKDFNLALEVMKAGASDYIVKEEISTPVFPKIILGVLEKKSLQEKFDELEFSRNRLEALQALATDVTADLEPLLLEMETISSTLRDKHKKEKTANYLNIIHESVERIQTKIGKLKEIKDDKTVTYVNDLQMIDLS
jgi:DNA-binding NarL/FixJ family response regulator